jgi:hypothetical protein
MRLFRLSAILAVILGALVLLSKVDGRAKVDCSLADFHPDYTTAMKERCRGLK